jgi:hypothetical protein
MTPKFVKKGPTNTRVYKCKYVSLFPYYWYTRCAHGRSDTMGRSISAHEGGCGDENGDINIGGDSGDTNVDDRMAAAPPPLVRKATTRTTTAATLFHATAPQLHASQRPIADKRRDNPSGGGPGGRTPTLLLLFLYRRRCS